MIVYSLASAITRLYFLLGPLRTASRSVFGQGAKLQRQQEGSAPLALTNGGDTDLVEVWSHKHGLPCYASKIALATARERPTAANVFLSFSRSLFLSSQGCLRRTR